MKKYTQNFVEFINEQNSLDEGLSTKDLLGLEKYLKKINKGKNKGILNSFEDGAFVIDPKFQSKDREEAIQLFDLWAGDSSESDFFNFMAANTWIPHDDILSGSREAGNMFYDIANKVHRGQDDRLLKKLKFWI